MVAVIDRSRWIALSVYLVMYDCFIGKRLRDCIIEFIVWEKISIWIFYPKITYGVLSFFGKKARYLVVLDGLL